MPTKNKYLSYIHKYWEKVTQHKPEDLERTIGLPHAFVSPNCDKYTELYYWDSYFHIRGLIESGYTELAKNVVDNLCYLINRFGIIPNANSFYFLSRSQAPFLTSMILEVYEQTKEIDWLHQVYSSARKEYEEVWTSHGWKNCRNVFDGLCRYYDINDLHFLAELESGWDLTSRFLGRCMDILPIDLNCLLYKYEMDFAKMGKILKHDPADIKRWEEKAKERAKKINKYMWDRSPGIYRDYDFVNRQRTSCLSLAAYFPMFMKIATKEQAKLLAKNIKLFEYDGGLVTTKTKSEIKRDTYNKTKVHVQQWDYPNGWAPLQLIVIEGLMNYGYQKDAERIAKKWMKICEDSFDKQGFFSEKYNVVDPDKRAKGHYNIQGGFGWTNAVYALLHQKFKRK